MRSDAVGLPKESLGKNTIVNKTYNFEFMRKYNLAILIERAL